MITEKDFQEAQRISKLYEKQNEQLCLHSIATQYAEFCVMCDREKLPLLCLEDYINQYCH